MTHWHPEAEQELLLLARSAPPGSGKIAGEFYQMASRLNAARANQLARLRSKVADIRHWDFDRYAIYFRVDGNSRFTVLHVGEVTGALRVKSNNTAISRA